MTDRDRAISDVLGYIFVFAIISITIAVVYGVGISGLMDARESQQIKNVETAFEVLDHNIDDITDRGAESRATEIKLSGGTISVGQPVDLHVKTNSTASTVCNETRKTTISTRPIVYRKDSQRVIYAIGATFRSDGTKSAMITDPGWVVRSGSSVIPVLSTTTVGSTSTGGDVSILLIVRQRGQKLRCAFADPGPIRVNVTIESPRAPAWKRYFEDQGYTVASSSEDRVVAKFTTRQFYVTDTTVEVEYIT